jgi:outer membrane protein assembly factor BamB
MSSRLTFIVVLACASLGLGGEDWPQFRGPDAQGHSDAVGLPLEWSEAQHVVWKTEIPGQGWSSPVIASGRVWMTTATEDGRSLRAISVDCQSGRVLQDIELFHRETPIEKHGTNSYASPTPILDGERLFVHFGTMGTACVDTSSARVVWRSQEFQLDHECGPGSSPALCDNLLLFNCDGTDVQFGAALDKNSGALVWKTNRSGVITKPPDRKKAFVTPLVISVGGRKLVIMTGAEWVYAYDAHTGEEVWNVKHPGFSVAPTPVFGHGMVYVSTGYMLPQLLAIRPDGVGDVTVSHVAWKGDKNIPTKPSPLLVGDELYLLADGGILSCWDALTGKQHYRQRLGGTFSASPIFADGRIYCSAEDGRMIVVAPGTTYQALATNKLDGQFMASPAIVGRALYLRSATHLYRVEAD